MAPGRPLTEVLADLQEDPTNQEAWSELYRRTWPGVLSLSYRSLGGRADLNDAEDLAQDVFVRLARSLHEGRLQLPQSEPTFRTLLAVMTRNRAMDFLRRARRKGRDVRRSQELPADVPGTDPSPEAVALAQDLFYQILSRLDRLQQQMLWLLMEGRSQAEIAEQLGISVRTLQRHLEVVRELYTALRATELPLT